MSTAPAGRTSIYKLPISSSCPIYHLTPDPLFPTPASLLELAEYTPPAHLDGPGPPQLREGDPVPPSMLRRSRQIRGGGAFTFTSPLPLEFPYDFSDPEDEGNAGDKPAGAERQAKPVSIETQLAGYEVSRQHPVIGDADSSGKATAFSSRRRLAKSFPKAELLSLSTRCAKEWLPQLDTGDVAGTAEAATREKLIDVLSGKTVLAREADGHDKGFAPWSLCYGGHQFGSWAGQLGDGRAISLLSTPTTSEVASATGISSLELQLKGAGRTPYSRFADGLAVLRSSIREYLGAEAMAALSLPTSRALALVGVKSVRVARERVETAAIVTRVAPTWIRIGNFQIQHTRKEWESLRRLTHFVAQEVLRLPTPSGELTPNLRSEARGVLSEVARRTGVTIAGWQAYGFMHGVMNTDNIGIAGHCIDYGPYAFMDVFDPYHICNHSDEEGRYSYRNQPTMGLYAVRKLGEALAELIGHEVEVAQTVASSAGDALVAASEGWHEGIDASACREIGEAELKLVDVEFMKNFHEEYQRLMRLRLGFLTSQESDDDLLSSLLNLMERHSLDYSKTLRLLCQFPGTTSASFYSFLSLLLPSTKIADEPDLLESLRGLPKSSSDPAANAGQDALVWLESYEKRLNDPEELRAAESSGVTRRESMEDHNPRFVLRQWVLEEVIAKVDKEDDLAALDRVLEMASEPFKAYGEVQVGDPDVGLCELIDKEERERQRLCGLGDPNLLGFQCSCSS